MVWPTPQEYQEAIQNPQVNLGDPELRAGRVGLDVLGLPRPISGNFASVYRVVCGTNVWAVRCFLHPVTDLQQRYAEISRRLQDVRLPYTVGFDYVPRGVRVRGQWYPVLKMAWVQGTPLHEYVRQHLRQPPALLDLATRWLEMSAALQAAGIAHGDLQHGNVLVADGQPKLIDYDGMYVPALAGRRSHELGHRHYQHPQRTETDFGPQTDRFSSWVIYTALVALAADASLWDRTGAGEEFLLLRDEDFRRPEASATLNALAGHGDPRLRALADLLRTMVRLPLSAVPSLDGTTAPAGGQPLRFAPDGSVVRTLPPETDWLSAHLGPGTPSGPTVAPAPAAAAGPALGRDSWVLDHLRGLAPGPMPSPAVAPGAARLAPPGALAPRVALACLGVVALLLVVGRLAPGAPPAGTLAALAALTLSAGAGALFLLYGRDPAVQTMRAEARAVDRLRGQATRLEGDVRAGSARRRVIELRLGELDRRQAAALQELATNEAGEVRDAQERANRPVRAINDQLAQIDLEEAAALDRAGVRAQLVVAQINSALSALKAREQQESAAAAGTARQQWLERRLRARRVVQARIPGVGLVHRSALAAFGVVTAADVTYYRARGVPGIGDERAEALARWRRDEEARALALFPAGASATAVAQVRNRYQSQRDALERERAVRAWELAEAQRQLHTRYERQRQAHSAPLRQAMTKASGRTRRDAGEIAARYARRRAAILQRSARRRGALRGQLQAHDAAAAATVQRLWQVKWELARREPALGRFREVSFRRFLRRALLQQPG